VGDTLFEREKQSPNFESKKGKKVDFQEIFERENR
jgi:hypothetical protein